MQSLGPLNWTPRCVKVKRTKTLASGRRCDEPRAPQPQIESVFYGLALHYNNIEDFFNAGASLSEPHCLLHAAATS